jgi:hypothetical protein
VCRFDISLIRSLCESVLHNLIELLDVEGFSQITVSTDLVRTQLGQLGHGIEADGEGDTAADRGIRARPQIRDDVRESFGTSLMDAEPESRVNLVSPSYWPFLAAVATGIIFVGAMFTLWAVPIGALLFCFTLIGWHWPFSKELAS